MTSIIHDTIAPFSTHLIRNNPSNLGGGCMLSLKSPYIDLKNSKWYDASQYNNSAAIIEAARSSDKKGLYLDGISNYVRIPHDITLDAASKMSAFLWVKGGPQNNKYILSNYDYGVDNRSFAIYSDDSSPYQKIRVIITDDGIGAGAHKKIYTTSMNVLDNYYHLIGFRFDNGDLKLFIDGIQDPSPSKDYDEDITSIHVSDSDIIIGGRLNNDVPTSFFVGDTSNTSLHDQSIPDNIILSNYNQIKEYYQ